MSDLPSPPPMEPYVPDPNSVSPGSQSDLLGRGKLPIADEKTMGMLAHILGGVTSFLGPLIIWLIKKDESPFVNDQGREALNFQITIGLAAVLMVVFGLIAQLIPVVGQIVGCVFALLYPLLWVTGLVFGIIGGLAANKGLAYRYPFAVRLIS